MNGNDSIYSIVRRCGFLLVASAVLLFFTMAAGAATLFVSDAVDNVIHRFDATTGAPIMPDILLASVTGLATGPSGDLFAVSQNPSQVYRYDSMTGAQIGGPFVTFTGQNDGHDVQGAEGMAFAPNGNLYIADTTLSDVHVYDTNGNSITSLVPSGSSQPTDVAFDAAGDLYVASASSVLKSIGGTQLLTQFIPAMTGGVENPAALTFGPDGKLYVLDVSTNSGPAIRRYTAAGADDGTFISYATTLFQPSDIAFGPDGKLYVSGIDLSVYVGQVLRYSINGTPDGMLVASGPSDPRFMAFSSVPEPATLLLLAIAGGVALLRRRRK